MPRPRSRFLRVDYKLSISAVVAAQIDLLFEDPITRRPKYGARSRLVESLLKRWLAEQKGGDIPPVPSLEEITLGESYAGA